jgi:protein O-mannosyl-transferase
MLKMSSFLNSLYNHISIRKPLQLLLIMAIALTAYYPVVFGELCAVDDVQMVSTYLDIKSWTMKDVFTPGWQVGVYYRPLMVLSYLFDNYLFHLDEGFLHLENILLHTFNAFLVFWLAYQLLSADKKRKSYLPLLTALVFVLHPINTESVSWISGRTDVLACSFVLLSANCLLLYRQNGRYRFLIASGAFMFMGFLVKEIALAFLPGALLIMTAHEDVPDGLQLASSRFSASAIKNVVYSLVAIAAVIAFVLLRSHAILSNDSNKIGFTIKVIFLDIPDAAMVVLNSFVFYLKKLYIPFPLDFTIIEIDPLYEFLGLPLVMLSLFILSKRSVLSSVFMSGIFLITPAFMIAFNQIAWTPYAERYVYISSAFIMSASVLYLGNKVNKPLPLQSWVAGFTVVLLIIMAVTVFQRSLVWKTNLALLKDGVDKNPELFTARVGYGFALVDHGDFRSAREQFVKANSDRNARLRIIRRGDTVDPSGSWLTDNSFYQNRFGYWEDADLGLAYLLEKEGKADEAAKAYEQIIKKSGGRSEKATTRIIIFYVNMLTKTRNRTEAKAIKDKLDRYTNDWKNEERPDVLFWVGRTLYSLGDKRGALIYFQKAHADFNNENEYKKISEKFIRSLEKVRV